ncbi:MAG: hypothetical protein PUF48_03805 [Oscillospiraceae bacterium]|nr:hypothetical protein [Oscillospiraceae bacterium]
MKKFLKIISVILLLTAIIALPLSAASGNTEENSKFSITVPDGYLIYSDADDLPELAEFLGLTEAKLENYLIDNKINFFAIEETRRAEIKVSMYKDEFSEKTLDFSLLNDKDILNLAESVFENSDIKNSNVTSLVKSKGTTFLKNNGVIKDGSGSYLVTQYVTVSDSYNISLSIIYSIMMPVSFEEEIFNSFSLGNKSASLPYSTLLFIGILVAIIFFAAVIVIAVIGVIKNLKGKDNDDASKEDIEAIDIRDDEDIDIN